MKTEEEEEDEEREEEDKQEEGLSEQDSEDLSAFAASGPLTGNHGDRDMHDGNRREDEDEDVGGLINSDGEEEDWRPASIGNLTGLLS
ncbi:major centromere autoantigen B-like, partial [Etheostoma cragini]|uniref:major centromere autoantigen B-like n=1 Tax=Etheostoma cragini TaxID=417921 RepID=UPI00155ED763